MPDGSKPNIPISISANVIESDKRILTKTDKTGYLSLDCAGPIKLIVDPGSDTIDVHEQGFGTSQIKIDIHLVSHDQELDPITITGTFFRKSISSNPYNIRVIGKKKITSMAAQNLSDVLQNESNIQLGQDAVIGTSAIMQGIGGNDIKILLNGIPIIGRIGGNIDVSQIPMSNVERIEIIEGPMSVIYGSDALGGIINIITKEPLGKSLQLKVNSYADNIENYNVNASVQTRINKSLPISLNVGRQFFRGKDFDNATRTLDWKPKEKIFADFNTIYKHKNISFRLGSNFFTEELTDRSNAENNLITYFGYNSKYYTYRWDNQIQLNLKFNNYSQFQWQNAFNIYTRRKSTTKRNLVTGEENAFRPQDQDTTNFRLINSRGVYLYKAPSRKMDLNIGFDFTHEIGNGKRIPVSNPGITDFAAFATFDLHPSSQWDIQPSLRVVNNSRYGSSIIKDYGGTAKGFAPLIPSLQLKYKLSKHLVFRGSYSKGYRAPSIKELFFNFVDIQHNVHGNENLDPETSDNFIISADYRHRLSAHSFTNFNFSIFNNNIRNKITLGLQDALTNYYTYINVGRFRSQGLNVKFGFKSKQMNYSFSSTLISVVDEIPQEDSVLHQNYLNGQVAFNVTRKFIKKNTALNVITRYTSPTFGYNEDLTRYKIGGFYLVDAIYSGKLYKQKIGYQFGIKNILGITSVNSNRSQGNSTHAPAGNSVLVSPGRLFFLSLNLNLF